MESMGKWWLIFLLIAADLQASMLCRLLLSNHTVKVPDSTGSVYVGSIAEPSGLIHVSRLNGVEAPFELAHVVDVLRKNGHPLEVYLESLGFSLVTEGGVEYVLHPSVEVLNARLKTPRFEWDESTKITPAIEFARMLARGKIPISRIAKDKNGYSLYHHDLFNHGVGYAIMPDQVMNAIQARMHAFVKIYEKLPEGKSRKELLELLDREILALDGESSMLFRDLWYRGKKAWVETRLHILASANALETWRQFHPASKEIDAIINDVIVNQPSPVEIAEMAEGILNRYASPVGP